MRKIFSVTALIACSQLQAQQDTSRTMDEVVVTATKYSTKTTETGKLVTVISRQDIQRAGSRDLSQLITEMGGVFINGYTNSAGKEKNIYLRGAKAEHTLITIDGIPVYDASGIGSNFDIRNFPIDAVERVEILKGSQSTLYGSDAMAGVINIITRKAGNKKASPYVTAHYGSFNTLRLNAGVNGKAGILDYQVGATHFKSDGFSEATQDTAIKTAFAPNGFEQNSVQASFGITASPVLRIQPFIRYNKNKGQLDQGPYTDELDYTYESRNIQAGVRNTLQIGKTALTLLYQLNTTKRSYTDDTTRSKNGYYPFSTYAYDATEHFAEAFTVFNLGKQVKLTTGVDLRQAGYDYTGAYIDPWTPGLSRDTLSSDSASHRQLSGYAALNLTEGAFHFEAGARYNHHSLYGGNFSFNFNPSYWITPQVKVFANLSSGYKTPSLYQLFSEIGNQDLKPETAINWEGGLQYNPNNNSRIRVAYFNRKAEDVIAYFYNMSTFRAYYVNQDKQQDYGVDVEGATTLFNKVQLKALYSYVTGKIETVQGGKDTSYFNLIRRPKHLLNFSAGSQLTKALYVNLQLNSVGSRRDVFYDANFTRQETELPAYLLLNFYAEYGVWNNRLKIFADLRNITDRNYTDVYGYNTARFNGYGGIRFQL